MLNFVDTHCHINVMVKGFEKPLTAHEQPQAKLIVDDAANYGITSIINVGTSLIESQNCVILAQWFENNYAVVGIHPNDCTPEWREDIAGIKKMLKRKVQDKIVGIGECGLDFHYPDYNKQRQTDAFKAQIELALEHELALVVHSRDARDETLRVLEEYQHDVTRGIIHCFSEDLAFAQQVIAWNYALGIGGTLTYPKNNHLREVAQRVKLSDIVLETDAPFLPPQPMRGKQNSPASINYIAHYLAELRNEPVALIAKETTERAKQVFGLF